MDSTEQQNIGPEPQNEPPYWTSVGVASFIFGLIIFVISIISTYLIINSEPTGSFISVGQVVGILACLIGAFGGMLALWHYTREYDVSVTLGKGALIGFLAGAGIAVISILLGQIWQLIDPDMTQKLIDSTIANLEAMEIPEDQKQQIIDSTVESLRSQYSIGSQLLWGVPIYGILNLITGMIGAKVFGKDEDETGRV